MPQRQHALCAALLLILAAAISSGCAYRPDTYAFRAESGLAVSARQPTSPEIGGSLDITVMPDSGSYDFMGGSLVTLFTPERTRIGGRYDWEISNLRDYTQDRAIIHLGALGFADFLDGGDTDGGIGGMAEARYEFMLQGYPKQGIALFLAGQIEGHFVAEDFNVWVTAGLGYTFYL